MEYQYLGLGYVGRLLCAIYRDTDGAIVAAAPGLGANWMRYGKYRPFGGEIYTHGNVPPLPSA